MQHGKFLRSWVFQVAFLAAAGFAVMPSYSGLTKIRTRRRAADSTHVTARRGNAVLVFVNSLYNVCTACSPPFCPIFILTPPTSKRRKLPCCIWLAWVGLSGSLGKAGGLPIVLCGGETFGVGVVDAVALGNVGEVVADGVAQGVAAFDVELFAQLVKTFGGRLGE